MKSNATGAGHPIDNFGSRYLGASSGIAFLRSSIDFARRNGIFSLQSTPDTHTHTHSKLEYFSELLGPSRLENNPPRGTVEHLFHIFRESQAHCCIITELEFSVYLDQHYGADGDRQVHANAAVYLVCATSMLFLGRSERSSTALKQADFYFEQVMRDLPRILTSRDVQTLQILLLVLRFSLSNPQKPMVWHLLGFAMRLATRLGLHREPLSTHTLPVSYEVNLKRRLFWSLYSYDRAVGNTLGR